MDFIHITAPYYEVWISFFHKKWKSSNETTADFWGQAAMTEKPCAEGLLLYYDIRLSMSQPKG